MRTFLKGAFSLSWLVVPLWFVSCSGPEVPTALPPAKVMVVEAESREVPVTDQFVGQVYGKSDIPIRARVEGFLEGIHFQEGRRVRRGQLLYTIDPQPFQANVASFKSQLAQAHIHSVRAENDLERIEPLAANNAVSKSDLDAAIAEKEAADAAVEAAEAGLRMAEIQLSYTRITSPLNGIIGKTQAKVGEFVGREPNPVILNTVSNIDSFLVEFFLPEQDYLSLARETRERLREAPRSADGSSYPIQLILADNSIYPYPGLVRFVDRQVNPNTGSLLIQTIFPNPEGLIRPGQFAKVEVTVNVLDDAVLIPQRCISEFQGRYHAFVLTDSSTVEQRQLELGPVFKDYRVIRDGITTGEKVVFEGLQLIRDGARVESALHQFESQVTE